MFIQPNTVYVPTCRHGYGEKTFDNFEALFYNKFLLNISSSSLATFKTAIYSNLIFLHKQFIETFSKFDIKFSYKHFKK